MKAATLCFFTLLVMYAPTQLPSVSGYVCNVTVNSTMPFVSTMTSILENTPNASLPIVICLENGTFTGCSSSGARMSTLGGGPVTLVGMSFPGQGKPVIDCEGTGALFNGGSTNSMHIENLEIRRVDTNSNSGAVNVKDNAYVSLLNVDFFYPEDRTVRARDSASFVIRNCNFSFADGHGWGSNVVVSGGTSYIYDSHFGYNIGYTGTGIYMDGGTLYVHNSTFIGNSGSNDAVVSAIRGTLWMYNAFAAENEAYYAGFIRSDRSVKVYDSVMVNHKGSTWYVLGAYFGGDFTVSGCTFDSNDIRLIFATSENAMLTIDDIVVKNNKAYTAVHAVWSARVTVTNSVFESLEGGAVSASSAYNSVFSNNNITGVDTNFYYVIQLGVITGQTLTVENNRCEGIQSRGVYVEGGTATLRDNVIYSGVLAGPIWSFRSGGTATNNNVYNVTGADSYLYSYSDGGTFSSSEAVDVNVRFAFDGRWSDTTLAVSDINFTRVAVTSTFFYCFNCKLSVTNLAVDQPYVLDQQELACVKYGELTVTNLHSFTATKNHSLSSLTTITNGGTMTFVDSTIHNFTTTSSGAIASPSTSGGSLALINCNISNIHSGGNGGLFTGISGSYLRIEGSTVSNVTAAGDGGVVYSVGLGGVTVSDTTVTNVTAGGQGGVVMAFDGVAVNITSSTFSSNTADSGGAVFFAGGYLRVADSSFVDNVAYSSCGGMLVFLPRYTPFIGRSHFEGNSDSQLFVFAAKAAALDSIGVVARSGQVGVELLSVADAAVSNSSLWSEGVGEALRVTASLYVSVVGSLVAGEAPGGTPSLLCTASTLNVVGGVTCFNGGAGAQCSACTLTGDVSTCSDLYSGGSCVDSCEAADWCVPSALLVSTAPNAGCPSCDGACYTETDECDALSTNCFDTRSGGFTCGCETGFESLANNSCTDIDECAIGTDDCDASAVCVNTAGSFTCDCVSGYVHDGPLACTDEDECATDPCGVEFDCYNSVGSYVCVCGPDYYIYGNSTECRHCTGGWKTVQNQYCVSECPTGFVTVGNTTCEDINECLAMPCGEGTKCINTPGSYSCGGCKTGYYKYNNSTECRPCAEGWYTLNGVACLECGSGTYTNSVNSPVCSTCEPFSTSGSGATSCYCTPGYVDVGAGCVANCTIGQYAYSATLCLNCPKGTYGSAAGLCDSCPPFTTTAATGHVGIDACECVDGDLVRSPIDFEGSGCVPWCGPGRYADVDDGLCLSCPTNMYKENAGFGDNCTVCPVAGMYTEGTGSANLTDCQCGEGQQIETVAGVISCTTYCAPGLSRPSPWEECEVCGSSTYSAQPNSKTCSICPANTFAPPQSTSVSACRCRKGFYAPTKETGRSCVPCPDGAECTGGLAEPVSREGFAPVGEEFIACTPASACIGKGECSLGYSGERCATCSPGYHRSSGYCQPCGAGTLVAVIFGVLCALVLVTGLVVFNMSEGSSQRLRSTVITLNAIQIIAQFGRLQIGWPLYVQRMFDVLGAFNLNVELVAPECAVGATNPFVIRFVTAMMVPLLLAAVLGGGYVIFLFVSRALSVSKPLAYSVRRSVLLCALQLILILYLPLSVATFEFFDCVPAGSKTVLASSPEVECGSGVWKRLLPLAAICVVLYPVAVPLVLTGSLAYGRYIYGAEDFDLRFGYLTNRYAPEYFYYELVVMARKLVVAITLTFVTASPYIQAGTTVIWILFNFLIHHIAKPYATDFLNLVESGSLFAVLLVIQEGVMFQDSLLTPASKAAIVFFTLFVFFAVAGAAITYEYSVVVLEGKTGGFVGGRNKAVLFSVRGKHVAVSDPVMSDGEGTDTEFVMSDNSAYALDLNGGDGHGQLTVCEGIPTGGVTDYDALAEGLSTSVPGELSFPTVVPPPPVLPDAAKAGVAGRSLPSLATMPEVDVGGGNDGGGLRPSVLPSDETVVSSASDDVGMRPSILAPDRMVVSAVAELDSCGSQ